MGAFGNTFGDSLGTLGTQLNLSVLGKSKLISELTANGIYAKCDAIYLLSDKDTPLIEIKGSGINATHAGALAPVHEPLRGYHTDTTGVGYLNTNFTPSVNGVNMTKDNAHISIYILENIPQSQAIFGGYDATNIAYVGPGNQTNGQKVFGLNATYVTTGAANKIFKGHHCVVREGNKLRHYINGALITEVTQTQVNLPTKPLYVGRWNNNGSASGNGLATYSVVTIGGVLTTSEVGLLNTAINNYITTIQATTYKEYNNGSLKFYRQDFTWSSQCGDYRFGYDYSTLYFSSDKGVTKITKAFAPAVGSIEFSHIFDNGNILFGTNNKIYKSTNQLNTITEITVTDGGSNYVPHIPISASCPGNYFRRLNVASKNYISGNEILVWGNYTNVSGGAAPVNIYYSADNGATVKIAYKFGQNPYYKDNGTSTPGISGNLVGDSGNAIFCRHVHSIAYNNDLNEFYVSTGDAYKDEGSEIRWMKGVYNSVTDTWTWSVLITASAANRYKAVGLHYNSGYVYWAADNTDWGVGENGIWKSLISDIGTIGNHVRLYSGNTEVLADMKIDSDGSLIAVPDNASNVIYYSKDFGVTTTKLTINELSGPMRLEKINNKNSDGYYMMNVTGTDFNPGNPTLFVKLV